MLTRRQVEQIDPLGMHREYEKWADRIVEARELEISAPEVPDTAAVLFAGVGGSATAGDVIIDSFEGEFTRPVSVVRGFHLPRYVGGDDFVVAISYSGDTQEVLSVVMEALEAGCKVASISSVGALESLSIRHRIPFTKIGRSIKPRTALPQLTVAAIRVLERAGVLNTHAKDLLRCEQTLRSQNMVLNADVQAKRNPAKQIALLLNGKLPVIYSSQRLSSVSTRFRAALNENAKMHAVVGVAPEIFHNEIEALQSGDELNRHVVILRSKDEDLEAKYGFDGLKPALKENGVRFSEMWSVGEDRLSRRFSLIYLLDYASIYLAVIRGVDPLPTRAIESMKRRMASKKVSFHSRSWL